MQRLLPNLFAIVELTGTEAGISKPHEVVQMVDNRNTMVYQISIKEKKDGKATVKCFAHDFLKLTGVETLSRACT
ncbi:MAG: hypothetical protein L7S02_00315 [Flavobacteriales bacterium]|nr:hypothetical protein [Flavobacteriales bacterium]